MFDVQATARQAKMYDKFSLILRIETTVNDISFFKHYREVEHRNGSRVTRWASMQKTIYSLPALRELLVAANRWYLEFISIIEDPRSGKDKLSKLSWPARENDRSFPGFNFFDADDQSLFEAIAQGEFNISGFQNRNLCCNLPDKTVNQISRQLKRLRRHGLIKKIGRAYKYYLTFFGKQVIVTGLKLKQLFIIPQLPFAR